MTPYNIRRIVGWTGIALVLVLLLASCAPFPSNFDNQEHARIVNIYMTSLDDSVCSNREQATVRADSMYQDARWVWAYGQHLPDNEALSRMETDLMVMTRELSERYHKADTVSLFYCRNKFENIRKATETMLKASARRPRS